MKPVTPEQAGAIPAQVLESLKIHLGNLEKALLAKDPEMPNHLRESHRLLISHPETVHLLDDEEIHKLIQAQEDWTKTKVVSDVAKSKGPGKKSLSKLTVNDL